MSLLERDDGLEARRDNDLPPSGETAFVPWSTPRPIRRLIVVNVVVALLYAGWWFVPGHVGTVPLFIALALAEAFTLAHVLGLWWAMWATRIAPPPPITTTRSIDVFITTYGEPVDLLAATVAAAVRMEGEHRTIVLDDACRPEVAEMAARVGADYLERRENKGAKAGNLNHALGLTDGELFVVFDADHVPQPDFLSRLVGYFEDDGVAFVQSPQYYVNGLTNPIARGAYQQQTIFYGPICRGKNGLGAVFCCGTNVVFRRQAVEDVGGFDETSVVEDFVTSMHVQRQGWRSVYYPYVLAAGLGPTTVATYFGQQFRWARGSVGALVAGEPFRRGFTLAQRCQYLLATTFYLIGLVSAVYVALPILYMFFGWSAFGASSGSFVFFYAPYFLLGLLTLRWALGRQLRLEHLQFTFGTFPVYALAAASALLRISARFNVTSKEDGADPPPRLAFVTVGASVLTLIGVVAGLFLRPLDARTATNIAWSVVNLMLLYPITMATVREARAATATRARKGAR